jgi:hypothetical protein
MGRRKKGHAAADAPAQRAGQAPVVEEGEDADWVLLEGATAEANKSKAKTKREGRSIDPHRSQVGDLISPAAEATAEATAAVEKKKRKRKGRGNKSSDVDEPVAVVDDSVPPPAVVAAPAEAKATSPPPPPSADDANAKQQQKKRKRRRAGGGGGGAFGCCFRYVLFFSPCSLLTPRAEAMTLCCCSH